ncbi:MAG: uroporphyrinogen decarboxylase family protein [Verrucomicrobiota bacterium]
MKAVGAPAFAAPIKLPPWGGGGDTRQMLPHGTPEEIKQHVRERIGIFNPGGGFVFQQIHNILMDVPPENVIAIFEAFREPASAN